MAKKLGLLASDGSPTDLYKRFRNSDSAKAAMAQALRTGYSEVFERNEYAGSLDKEKFKGLAVEITGLAAQNRVVQLICSTFDNLRKLADFDAKLPSNQAEFEQEIERDPGVMSDFSLGLSYTINLVLPKTDDPSVFNAIFKSLRENLLRK